MSRIQAQQALWDKHGQSDPLWAILTDPRYAGRLWNEKAFFETGQKEVALVLARAQRLGLKPRRGRALDFGCGVGRLTQALGRHFGAVEGIDISNAMILAAKRYNALGRRCAYHINASPDLGLYASKRFDFIYASIVLQHIPPALMVGYLKEFGRVLKPGGVLIFNLPCADHVPWFNRVRYQLRLRTRLRALAQRLGFDQGAGFDPHPIPMHASPESKLRSTLAAVGVKVLQAVPTNTAHASFYRGLRFFKAHPQDVWYPTLMYFCQKPLRLDHSK